MLTTREVIKTFYNALLQRLKKHRGNWDQNDPSADDYIKNRPFYTDETKKTVNVPEQEITILSDRSEAELVLPEFIEFVIGQTYEVKWDNKTYFCVAFDTEGIGAIGNQSVLGGGTDTGEPFIMMISKAAGIGIVVAHESIGTHTVEVSTAKVVKLDKKYLPDLGLAHVATSGSYYDLENAPAVYSDVVRYDTGQSLSTTQKRQAKLNIGAVGYDAAQSLTSTQKAQARTNIGAGTSSFSGNYNDLRNKPTIYSDVVRYGSSQSLTNTQKVQARTNIGAGTSNFSGDYNNLTNKPTGKIVEVFNDESNYALLSMYIPIKYDADNKLIPCEDGDYFYGMVTGSILGGVDKPYFICSLYDIFEPALMSYNDTTELQAGNVYNFVANNHDSFRLATSNDKKYRSMRVTQIVNEHLIRVVDDPINVATDIKDDIILIDQVNGYHYIACMQNGNFVTYCATKSIEITAIPTKIEYTAGEYFDPTGMIIIATAYDGTTKEITDFIYPSSYILNDDTFIEIKYIEAGITHIATVPVTVTPFDPAVVLVDFEYTANDDGTYTLTGWKGTYNGEASTEIIIPNNGLIKV